MCYIGYRNDESCCVSHYLASFESTCALEERPELSKFNLQPSPLRCVLQNQSHTLWITDRRHCHWRNVVCACSQASLELFYKNRLCRGKASIIDIFYWGRLWITMTSSLVYHSFSCLYVSRATEVTADLRTTLRLSKVACYYSRISGHQIKSNQITAKMKNHD